MYFRRNVIMSIFIAVEKIGPYNIGDEVPEAQAKVWEMMYKKSPVKRMIEIPGQIIQANVIEEKVIEPIKLKKSKKRQFS